MKNDGDCVLLKYTEEEIIELARLNPGFGIRRMASHLYPNRKTDANEVASKITLILKDHEDETGESLFGELQSTQYNQMVTENEYLRITGKNIPRGYGRRGGRNRGGKRINRNVKHKDTMIPLPPQELNWGQIVPESERSQRISKGAPRLGEYSILNLHHPFREYWDMWEDGYSRAEIAREHDGNIPKVGQWINLMIELDNKGGLEEWLEIVELLNFFEKDRGHSTYMESRNDMVILFVHSITTEFVSSPNTVERIDPKELVEAYRFACMEEEQSKDMEEEEFSDDFAPEVDLELEKARVMIEASLLKKIKSSGLKTRLGRDDYSPYRIPNKLSEAKVFDSRSHSVKNQILNEIRIGMRDPRAQAKLNNMLLAIEVELFRISKFELNELEFRTMHNEIIKISDEFGQEPWFELGETIDWTDRESLLRTMVNYALELNNLQERIIACQKGG